jgi:hypothetical protein
VVVFCSIILGAALRAFGHVDRVPRWLYVVFLLPGVLLILLGAQV